MERAEQVGTSEALRRLADWGCAPSHHRASARMVPFVQVVVQMRYHVLAADYDGTLAHHGRIDDATWDALRRLRDSGRKVVMVTGRQLEELLSLLSEPELFARIVAENGAVLHDPATKETRALADAPPPQFVEELSRRGVERVATGHVIVASWEPHQDAILHAIQDLGLELQVIFNKGAVMVLPSGVNKATGLAAALAELGLSAHNTVGVGDAENDHALLMACECGAAVANALPALKAKADLVLARGHGEGVAELIDQLMDTDLAGAAPARHRIEIGTAGAQPVAFDPYAANIMVCGPSGSGKSTLVTGLLERLHKACYQFAIVDPEGDYGSLEQAVVLGGTQREPLIDEVIDVLRDPSRSVVANLLGVAVAHRPECFARLVPAISELRTRTGRPHWMVVDEAHHMLPAAWEPAGEEGAGMARPHGTIYVTVHPESVAPAILRTIDTVLALGERPIDKVIALCHAAEIPPPRIPAPERLAPGSALYWKLGSPETTVVEVEPPKGERTRHSRKYVEGNMGSTRSFYFRGPDAKLNLKAHNLLLFVQLGDGVDDDTWEFHRRKGDYSRWFRDEVKDDQLAGEAEAIERGGQTPGESRAAIRAAVEKRYTLPADRPSGIVDES